MSSSVLTEWVSQPAIGLLQNDLLVLLLWVIRLAENVAPAASLRFSFKSSDNKLYGGWGLKGVA